MINAERAAELKRLRGCLGSNTFRTNLRFRRETLGQIVPLLNFNNVYHTNALQFADTLSAMKPTTPFRNKFGVLATTPCRGLSLSR